MNKILTMILCVTFILCGNISIAKTTYEATFFTSSSCHFCERFEKEILSDPEVKEVLKDVTIYRLDISDAKAHEFGIRVTPVLLFTKNGKKIGTIIGFYEKEEILRQIKVILS